MSVKTNFNISINGYCVAIFKLASTLRIKFYSSNALNVIDSTRTTQIANKKATNSTSD